VINAWPAVRQASAPNGTQHAMLDSAGPLADPTVGIYVIQHDWDAWTNRAAAFQKGLATGTALTNPQYYWAEPRMYTSDKDKFANSVNIVLTEGHGYDGGFVTKYNQLPYPLDANSDDREDVRMTDVPSPGYGGGANGVLAFWIIDSCNTVATEVEDPGKSFDRWWTIFNGLHAVLGYRTEGLLSDGVAFNFASAISQGAPMVGTWFNVVAADDAYKDNSTYQDDKGNTFTYGRASAIAVCGHEGDTANDIDPIPAAD
jgi:hypothetical protein